MHIRTFGNGDETALRAIFYSSVHALARKDYTAEQLDAWVPRQYDAGQWGERVCGVVLANARMCKELPALDS
jgi:putative acetyltransferase